MKKNMIFLIFCVLVSDNLMLQSAEAASARSLPHNAYKHLCMTSIGVMAKENPQDCFVGLVGSFVTYRCADMSPAGDAALSEHVRKQDRVQEGATERFKTNCLNIAAQMRRAHGVPCIMKNEDDEDSEYCAVIVTIPGSDGQESYPEVHRTMLGYDVAEDETLLEAMLRILSAAGIIAKEHVDASLSTQASKDTEK